MVGCLRHLPLASTGDTSWNRSVTMMSCTDAPTLSTHTSRDVLTSLTVYSSCVILTIAAGGRERQRESEREGKRGGERWERKGEKGREEGEWERRKERERERRRGREGERV